TRAPSRTALGDVQDNAVCCPSQLIRQPLLLVIRESFRDPSAFDRESFGVLPSLQCLVRSHAQEWLQKPKGTTSKSFVSCLSYAFRSLLPPQAVSTSSLCLS